MVIAQKATIRKLRSNAFFSCFSSEGFVTAYQDGKIMV
jgi:hypothetical protein